MATQNKATCTSGISTSSAREGACSTRGRFSMDKCTGNLHFHLHVTTILRSNVDSDRVGKLVYDNGESYEGEWNRGKRHGKGIYVYLNG